MAASDGGTPLTAIAVDGELNILRDTDQQVCQLVWVEDVECTVVERPDCVDAVFFSCTLFTPFLPLPKEAQTG